MRSEGRIGLHLESLEPRILLSVVPVAQFTSGNTTVSAYDVTGSAHFASSDIKVANRGKDPLYLFAALQRHLGYPAVPRLRPLFGPEKEIPALQAKLAQLEKSLHLVESELKGNLDLSQFYVKPVDERNDEFRMTNDE